MRYAQFAILSFAILLCTPAHAATRIDDPVKFVSGVYAKLQVANPKNDYREPEDIYTPRLAALFALAEKEAAGEVGRIDFDFWTNSQDFELKDVKVRGQAVEGAKDREVVIATFKNVGRPEEIHFYFEKDKSGWKLDDARSMSGGETWTLSLILKYGWDSGN